MKNVEWELDAAGKRTWRSRTAQYVGLPPVGFTRDKRTFSQRERVEFT